MKIMSRFKNERGSHNCCDNVADNNGLQRKGLFLSPEQKHKPGKAYTARNRADISPKSGSRKLVEKEQSYAAKDYNDSEPVEAGCLFMEKPGAQKSDIDRGSVLQQNGIGGGGQLGR